MGSIIVMAVVGYLVYTFVIKGKSKEGFTPNRTTYQGYIKREEGPDPDQMIHHPSMQR